MARLKKEKKRKRKQGLTIGALIRQAILGKHRLKRAHRGGAWVAQ